MKTIEHFRLIDTGLEKMPEEELVRLCREYPLTNLIHGWGTDADSALDHLFHNLREYGYEVTAKLVRGITDQYHPTCHEGDGEETHYHLYLHIGCTNMSYESVYTRQWDDEYRSLRDMRHLAQERFNEAIKAEQKRRQPRARTRFKDLPPEVYAKIREEALNSPLVREVHRLKAELEREKETKEKLLRQMAPQVAMVPDTDAWHHVASRSSGSFSSQGYGAMKYAKGDLEVMQDMLRSRGFDSYIRMRNYRKGTGIFAIDHCDYELWANCPKWMYDAATRTYPMSAAVESMKARCLNPFVYNPFLPEECRL
ncbi:MAG: hypothetical protein ACYS7Y_11775 [Planctomycetota bacterium]|jgi:hypothetical protein